VGPEELGLSDDRYRLPDPPRTGPHRHFTNILEGAGAGSHRDHEGQWEGLDEASEAAGSFVAEGVHSAYEVVDTYLRQGQRVARSLGLPSYEPPLPASHVNELSARWIHASSELMAIGFEFFGSLAESMAAGYPPRGRGGPGPWPVPQPGRVVRVHYEIASIRPAQVNLQFLPGRDTVALASHGLRSLDPSAPAIPVEFEPIEAEHCVLVRVQIPEDQPPDLYTGALLDAHSGESVGSLSLRIR
jgi:hypothetical protein